MFSQELFDFYLNFRRKKKKHTVRGNYPASVWSAMALGFSSPSEIKVVCRLPESVETDIDLLLLSVQNSNRPMGSRVNPSATRGYKQEPKSLKKK